jgi:hypothetical protein
MENYTTKQLSEDDVNRLQKFQARLNSLPAPESVEHTPDKKAQTVVISHIEMTLDELFFGQWTTNNFTWSAIANEVQGSLELSVVHPVSGRTITRVGAASIVITVDKVPHSIAENLQERNRWALNPSNKKPNALDLAFPKLKAECLKNAAQSLGKIFGRDLNRKNRDEYKPFKLSNVETGIKQLPESTMLMLEEGINSGQDMRLIQQALISLDELMTDEQRNHLNNLYHAANS